MKNKMLKTAEGVGNYNSETLLNYDYKKLRRDISRAVIAYPDIVSFFIQKDLSILTSETVPVTEIHMMACVRLTCAFIGLRDPFPGYGKCMGGIL